MTSQLTEEPLIEASNLGLAYPLRQQQRLSLGDLFKRKTSELWALRGLTFSLQRHQIVGVIGNNGSGKSTLCLLLAQILGPSEGSLVVRARVSSLLSLGAGYNRELSGRENMRIYSAFLGIPREVFEERLGEVIEFSGLGAAIDRPLRTFSSGMRARLSFSVATSLDPEVLLLDEVLSAGDLSFRQKATTRIEEMISESSLVIVVSHSLGFLAGICTHALWLQEGRMMELGETSEVIDAYRESERRGK